jgi:hypothetical protein
LELEFFMTVRFRAYAVGMVVLWLFVPGSSASAVAADDPLVASLDAAEQKWLHDVEFTCTYDLTRHKATSAKNALAGEYAIHFEADRVTGVLNKGFGKLRCSTNYSGSPKVVDESEDGTKFVKHLSSDEVASADKLLRYDRAVSPTDRRGSATINSRSDDPDAALDLRLSPYIAGPSSATSASPLQIDGSIPGSYLRSRDSIVHAADSPKTTREVIHNANDTVIIRVVYEREGVVITKQVRFLIKRWSVPVVDQVTTTIKPTRGKASEVRAAAFDFIECPGGPVARLVRCAAEVEDPALPWYVEEWRSRDLGLRSPTEEDFLVPIKRRTRIVGVSDPRQVMDKGRLSIDKAIPAVLSEQYPQRGLLAGEEGRFAATNRSRMWWLIGTNVALAIVLFLMLMKRKPWRR